MSEPTHIAVSGVSQAFEGVPVVRDISFSAAPGEFVSLVGPSGCGKSTMLRLVAGLLAPSSGTVSIGGRPPAAWRQAGNRIACVFQDPRLLAWRTVADNIALPLELEGLPAATRTSRMQSGLELIGLTAGDARKRPAMLSGGMRMRVSLARALVTEPRVLLLDEPFGALDELLRQQLNEELLRIHAQQGWTALFVTHSVSEAVFLSQRVLVMAGRPGMVMEDVPVDLPFPRTDELREAPEYLRQVRSVSRLLRGAPA